MLLAARCAFSIAAAVSGNPTQIPGNSPQLRFIGRHARAEFNLAEFDWVGSGVAVQIKSSNLAAVSNVAVVADLDTVGDTRFSVYRQEVKEGMLYGEKEQLQDFFAGDGRAKYTLAQISSCDECVVFLIKTNEPTTATMKDQRVVKLYGMDVSGATITNCTAVPSRRIDVYGDSDSAAYGIDSNAGSHQCNTNQSKQENFAHGWVHHIGEQLRADVHVQAVSGVGVAKNALDGAACSTKVTLPNLIKRTLQSVQHEDYNASNSAWAAPGAVLLYVGSNDYANLLKPTKANFSAAYDAMVRSILQPWAQQHVHKSNSNSNSNSAVLTFSPPPPPAVVHICGGEARPCEYIKQVAEAHAQEGRWKSVYTTTGDTGAKKGGCAGHRNATQQAALALRLGPIVAAAAGWA